MSCESSTFNSTDETPDSLLLLLNRLRDLGFHQFALKIEDCGRRFFARAGSDEVWPRWCRLKICPICRIRMAKATAEKFQHILAKVIEEGGYFYFLTFTVPPFGTEMNDAASLHDFARSFSGDAWWRGSGQRVAILTALEFGKENGHAHIHYLVVGRTSEAAFKAVDGLRSRWLRKHGEAVLKAQVVVGPLNASKPLENILGYITKGSGIDPRWSDEAIMAAIAHMTNYKRPFTASGLVLPPRRRPLKSVV